MRLTSLLKVWLVLPVTIIILAGCASSFGQSPTQTPLIIIVTNESAGAAATVTPDILPTPQVCSTEIVEQIFENGRMFWVGKTAGTRCKEEQDFAPGTGEIWVAIFDESGRGGEWLIFDDDWDAEVDLEEDPDLEAPEIGLIQPVRGFGKVWREKLSAAQREAIGWATTFEVKFLTDYRYEAGGFIDTEGEFVPRPGLHVLESFEGELFYFDEPSQTFDYVDK